MKKVKVFSKKDKIDKNKTSLNDEPCSIAKFRIGLGVCSFVFIFFIVFVFFVFVVYLNGLRNRDSYNFVRAKQLKASIKFFS